MVDERLPFLKHLLRSMEKMALSGWSAEGICDIVRCMITCSTMSQHAKVLTNILHCLEIRVTRVKERYANPSVSGWSDILINFVFMFAVTSSKRLGTIFTQIVGYICEMGECLSLRIGL